MTITNKRTKNKHHVSAMVVAFAVTALLGVVMLGLGINALFNRNTLVAQAATIEPIDLTTASPEEIQAVIDQYQVREAQYQQELNKAADQINQANSQIAGYQSLVHDLQSLGVIQVGANGQVTVVNNRPSERSFEHGVFGDDDDD